TRLERRFDLLRSDTQDRPDRHQTLRAALDWSYQLLPIDEQQLLRTLAVFVGGCSLDAVDRVIGRSSLDGLASLVDKSLLRQESALGTSAEPRFLMLETIRQYALEQLAATGVLVDAQRRHAEYCVGLAESAEPELVG